MLQMVSYSAQETALYLAHRCLFPVITGKFSKIPVKPEQYYSAAEHRLARYDFQLVFHCNYISMVYWRPRDPEPIGILPRPFTHHVTHLVWPHQPENSPRRPRAQRISP